MDAMKLLKLDTSLKAVIKAKLKWEEQMESHRQLMRSMNLLKRQHVLATVDDHHPHPTTTSKADLERTNSTMVVDEVEKQSRSKRVFSSDVEWSDCGGVRKRPKSQTKEGVITMYISMTQCRTILSKLMNHEHGYHVSANPNLKNDIICHIRIMSCGDRHTYIHTYTEVIVASSDMMNPEWVLLSRVMRQVLLPHVAGGPFWYLGRKGEGGCSGRKLYNCCGVCFGGYHGVGCHHGTVVV